MRKRIVPSPGKELSKSDENWLNLDALAEVEITSEDLAHPIEAALLPGEGSGWRAAGPGEQTIRILFSNPQRLRQIRLEFVEPSTERTQEFALRWRADGGESFREIVRQQWNFSPQGATVQCEDYRVDLPNVSMIELTITPDIRGGEARASLARLRLASSSA